MKRTLLYSLLLTTASALISGLIALPASAQQAPKAKLVVPDAGGGATVCRYPIQDRQSSWICYRANPFDWTDDLSFDEAIALCGNDPEYQVSVIVGAIINWGVEPCDAAPPYTGQAQLSWTAPTENEDGTVLDDLAKYRAYYSASPPEYVDYVEVPAGTETALIEGLTPGVWYFVATALDLSGNESQYSNEASKLIVEPAP